MITSKLSREIEIKAQGRLIFGWKDPDVLISTLVSRFGINPDDIEKLKLELGPKARPPAAERVDGGKPHKLLGNGWSRRLLARSVRRVL